MSGAMDAAQRRLVGDMRGHYSETTIDHAVRPRNVGSLPDADGYGNLRSNCGESMQIWLRLKNARIEQASFWTDGCAATIASGSMAAELAQGKTISEALRITARDVADAMEDLPEGNFHCAQLAAGALKAALRDAMEIQRDPWKKAYRAAR